MRVTTLCFVGVLALGVCAAGAARATPRHHVVAPGVTHGDLMDAVPLVSSKEHRTVYEMHEEVLQKRRERLTVTGVGATGATGTAESLPPLDEPLEDPGLVLEVGIKGLTKRQAHMEFSELKDAVVDVLLRSKVSVTERQLRVVEANPVDASDIPFTAAGRDPEYDVATALTVQFDISRSQRSLVERIFRRKVSAGAFGGAVHDRRVVRRPRAWVLE